MVKVFRDMIKMHPNIQNLLCVGAAGTFSLFAMYQFVKRYHLRNRRRSTYEHWTSDSDEAIQRSYRDTDIPEVLRVATADGLFGIDTDNPVAIFHDMDCQKETLLALRDAYPPHFFHTFAVKSNPLPFVLRTAIQLGMGLEAASFGEVANCLRQVPSPPCPKDLQRHLRHRTMNPLLWPQGCPPERIVFDSPAKTRKEIAVRHERT